MSARGLLGHELAGSSRCADVPLAINCNHRSSLPRLHSTKETAKHAHKEDRASQSWTKEDVHELKAHSKARTPVSKIAKAMKRTEGAIRQKALVIGIGIGHRR